MLDPERHKQKVAKNRARSTELLRNHGVTFTLHNNGVHLVVEGKIDFWPGTGKYIIRKTGRKGRGVFNLLKELTRQDSPPAARPG